MNNEWFTTYRLAMQTRAQNNLLKKAITDTSTIDDMLELDRVLETYNHPSRYDSTELMSEVSEAISAQVVSVCDKQFTNQLIADAGTNVNVRFNVRDAGREFISEIMDIVHQMSTRDVKVSIIANPLVVSVFQSIPECEYHPKMEGFKGPSSSSTTVNGVPLYSYIYEIDIKEHEEGNMGTVILVSYDDKTEQLTSSVLHIYDCHYALI